MTEDKKHWIECIICHEQFDMVWGQEDLTICDSCNGKKAEEMHEEKEVEQAFEDLPLAPAGYYSLEEQIDILNAVVGYYANPDNWSKHSVTGHDADGREVEETFYRGDGGELARKFWRG